MKRCPSCNRTYADETLSFCLADGSLLSAPYNPSIEEASPTEVLPVAIRPALPPTQAAEAAIPTIPSLPLRRGLAAAGDGAQPRSNSRRMSWVLWVLVAVVIVVSIVLAFSYGLTGRDQSANTSNPQGLLTANNAPSPSASSSATNHPSTTPARSVTPPERKKSAELDADPALFPTNPSQPITTPAPSPTVDYSRIFLGKDVDSSVKILEKPDPQYTVAARQNQIAGTIVIKAVFSSSGQVTNIVAVTRLPDGLTERAIAAARQIRFVPATKNGHPVSMYMQLEYHFNLY